MIDWLDQLSAAMEWYYHMMACANAYQTIALQQIVQQILMVTPSMTASHNQPTQHCQRPT